MRITQATANSSNETKGCRITVKTNDGKIIDVIYAQTPKGSGIAYCEQYPTGEVAKQYIKAVAKALVIDNEAEKYINKHLFSKQKWFIKNIFNCGNLNEFFRFDICKLVRLYTKETLVFQLIKKECESI